jgi:hypothetical protein
MWPCKKLNQVITTVIFYRKYNAPEQYFSFALDIDACNGWVKDDNHSIQRAWGIWLNDT